MSGQRSQNSGTEEKEQEHKRLTIAQGDGDSLESEPEVVAGALPAIRTHPRGSFSGELPKLEAKKDLDGDEVEACKAYMSDGFGPAVAQSALRIIAQREDADRKIRGEHMQFAFAAARDMIAPQTILAELQRTMPLREAEIAADKSGRVLDFAQKDLTERTEAARPGYDSLGNSVPGFAKPGQQADKERAEIALKRAQASHAESQARLNSAMQTDEALTTYRGALAHIFAPGEDSLSLERDADPTGSNRTASHQPAGFSSGRAESFGIKTEAVADLQEITGAAQSRLAAMQNGPPLRRMQGLLDNLGDDPRLAGALQQRGVGQNVLKRTATTASSPKAMIGVIAKLIPGLNIAVALGLSIGKEDQERKLRGGVEALQQWTRVAAIAEILADSKEAEKKVQGAVAAAGFLMTGPALPVPAVSGVGILAAHAGIQVIAQADAAVATASGSHAAGQALAIGGTVAAGRAVGTTMSKTTASGVGAAVQPAHKLEVSPALPFIPGPKGATFMLTQPPVLLALLEYLGPACDKGRLAGGGEDGDQEERRMRLREEMFGTPRDKDLRKGKTAPTGEDKALWDKLNEGSGAGEDFGEVDPLSLLYVAMGWMDFPFLHGFH